MFGLTKKAFIGLLTGLVIGSNHAKCVSLSNQKCMTQPTLINLHPNEYSQEFHYHSLALKLDRCVGSFNFINDLSNKVCVPINTKDLNLSVFNMIAGINELKVLTKHISCECKCSFDGRKCNSNQWWNNDKCSVYVKNVIYEEKNIFEILLHVGFAKMENISCENGKYSASIMDD